jgi:hypothetical protein
LALDRRRPGPRDELATGPMTEEEAAGIAEFGDFSGCAAAIGKLAAG